MSDATSSPPPLRWPKIAAVCVTLFFLACVLFMVKEVRRVQRINRETQEMRREMQSTSAPPPSAASRSPTNDGK